MCFPLFCLIDAASLSPYLLVLLMPLYGSLFGVHGVLRISVILYLYAIGTCALSRYLGMIGPIVSCVALAMASTIQMVIIPTWLLWIYERFLWILEPCLEAVEVLMIVSITMAVSCWIMELDFEYPQWGKVIIIMITLMSYTAASFLYWVAFTSDFLDNYAWLTYTVIASCIVMTLVMTLYKDEGIISDAAVVCLISSLILLIANWEKSSYETVQQIRLNSSQMTSSMVSRTADGSLLEAILSMPQVSLEYANQPIELCRKVFSMPFWVLASMRVSSAIWLIYRLCQMDKNDDSVYEFDADNDEQSLLGTLSRWRLSTARPMSSSGWLSFILASILVYTQIVAVHLSPSWAGSKSPNTVDKSLMSLQYFPAGMLRLVQSIGLFGFYLYKLWDNSQDIDW